MKRAVCFLLSFLLCFSVIPICNADSVLLFSDDPKAIQKASNSVVMISCYDRDGQLYSTGSAFAAFGEGIFITNFHVIEDNVYAIRAQMETGLEFSISSVVSYNIDKDIAILYTEAKTGLEPLTLGNSTNLERGEKVIAIGSPLGLINTLSIGLYSGTVKEEQTYLQFSASISHGSSGGALFNNRGEVIGITSASFSEGENLNLAIPINEVKCLFEEADLSKALSMTAFYDSFEHKPPVSIYTVAYVLNHYKELDGQEMYIEGYVSSVDSPKAVAKRKLLFLVPDLSSVAGYILEYDENAHKYGNGYDYEARKQQQYLNIRCNAPVDNNNLFNSLSPNTFVRILGTLNNKPRSVMDSLDGISYPEFSAEDYVLVY